MPFSTREAYLNAALGIMRSWFSDAGYELPMKIRISVGIPAGGKGSKLKRIGECWSPKASADATTEIFICPSQSDILTVLATLVHELVHAAVGLQAKHGKIFKRCAVKLGLEGKMTATTAGLALTERLNALSADLGAYPHAALNTELSGRKKQGTRMVKCVCPSCGYTARTTMKWIETGPLVCGPCQKELQVSE